MRSVAISVMSVIALVAAGLMVVVWGGDETCSPEPLVGRDQPQSVGTTFLRLVRAAAIGVSGGALAGVCVAGFGGRLMMRIMAATSGEAAQGQVTQAEEVVGRISIEGTLVLLIFIGIGGGAIFGILYLFVRRWLSGSSCY